MFIFTAVFFHNSIRQSEQMLAVPTNISTLVFHKNIAGHNTPRLLKLQERGDNINATMKCLNTWNLFPL